MMPFLIECLELVTAAVMLAGLMPQFKKTCLVSLSAYTANGRCF